MKEILTMDATTLSRELKKGTWYRRRRFENLLLPHSKNQSAYKCGGRNTMG